MINQTKGCSFPPKIPTPPLFNPSQIPNLLKTLETMPTMLIAILITYSLIQTAASRSLPTPITDETTSSSSIYDALTSHGLPMGLLPKGVNNFTLDDDGTFQIFLDQPCNAKLESELHFDRNVSGALGFGQIENLTGIASQELFLWFPVKGIRVEDPGSGIICFDVGVVSKQFSLSLFETPPDCFVGGSPPDLIEGKSIIRALDESRDALLIRRNEE